MRIVLVVLALMLLPVLAYAQSDHPLVSAHRLQLGGGVNYESLGGDDSRMREFPALNEFSFGLYGAYNIVPQLDIVGSTVYGAESKVYRSSVGLRVTLFAGGE